ncbi:hypothetical protein ADEAN_000098900 [Angomonas deanei]|uniref:Uncharacterized protein n=1 Tax=Angomonas deanei TaxID=59799 RepID=A0A7G2C1P6_9TRYP|nr:hypothetical protein ADEAN_000098900 [Angomonas deanei]
MDSTDYEVREQSAFDTMSYGVEIFSPFTKQWKKAVVQVVKGSPKDKLGNNSNNNNDDDEETFIGVHVLTQHTEKSSSSKKGSPSSPKKRKFNDVNLTTLLEVYDLCPSVAYKPLSLEIRAALKLLLSDDCSKTYTTHGTPRSTSGTPVNSRTGTNSPGSFPLHNNPIRRPSPTYIHSPEVPHMSRGNSLASLTHMRVASQQSIASDQQDTRTEPYQSTTRQVSVKKDLLTPFVKNDTVVFKDSRSTRKMDHTPLPSHNSSFHDVLKTTGAKQENSIHSLEELFDIELTVRCFRTCMPKVEVRPHSNTHGIIVGEGGKNVESGDSEASKEAGTLFFRLS